jgi:hypothetical protein
VELDAGEASISELGKQALDMFREASDIHRGEPAGPAFGFTGEKRWTPDHTNTNYQGSGFAPVKAEES